MARPSFRVVIASVLLVSAAACADDPGAPIPLDDGEPIVPRATMSTSGLDRALRLAQLPNGLVILFGVTDGALDGPHLGAEDVFVRLYHPEGEMLWGRQFGSPQDDAALGAAGGPEGTVVVVGQTGGSIAGTRGGPDGFMRVYDVSGNVVWTRQVGTAADDALTSAVVAADGSIYVAGYAGAPLIGGGVGGIDAILRKYAPDGEIIWTRQFGTTETDAVLSIALAPDGTIVVAGLTGGDMRGTNAGGFDAFVRKYGADGTVVWTRQEGSTGDDSPWGLAVDDLGRVIVSGYASGDMFGPVGGSQDGFWWRLTSTGATQIGQQFGSDGTEFVFSMAIDASRNTYVVGSTDGALDGPGSGTEDGFVRKYLPTGAVAWTRQVHAGPSDEFVGVAANDAMAIFVAGATDGVLGSANAGGEDAVLLRLNSSGQTVWTDQ